LAHCNQWPYENGCKYGEDDSCPALKVSISTERLAQVLYSVEGGMQQTDGTWNDDLVRDQFLKRADHILKILIGERRI
jgi:hypothetical protein